MYKELITVEIVGGSSSSSSGGGCVGSSNTLKYSGMIIFLF